MNRNEACKILGVNSDSTEQEIKNAYRKMAKKHHPDKNQGNKKSEEKFKQVTAAYEFLTKNEEDPFIHDGFNSAADNFDRFFKSHFHRPPPMKKPRPGSDPIPLGDIAPLKMRVTLYEALTGKDIRLDIVVRACCSSCLGPKAKWVECKQCSGLGAVIREVRMQHGHFSSASKCGGCLGLGWISKNMHCKTCRDNLVYDKKKEVKFRIPPGYVAGKALKFRGLGNEGWKTTAGSLHIIPIIELPNLNDLNVEDCVALNDLLKKGKN